VVHSKDTNYSLPYIWEFIPRIAPEGGETSILLRDALFAFNACRKITNLNKKVIFILVP
jgi:hypothetical protein